jgi:dTDP-4-dehydrorhamnose reductase
MTIVVLGESGQVARHLSRLLPDARFWGRNTVDACDAGRLEAALLNAKPSAIVNAAAYTAVDRAESERDIAWRLNAEAPAAAARAATTLGVPLVHLSTDYVFDGRKGTPYEEHDPVNPLNVYGFTKLAGELAIRSHCSSYWILRTSWVFSEYGRNFVTTMVDLASSRDSIDVVADQYGRPTYAGDLAEAIHALISGGFDEVLPPGLYHAAGGQVISWREFAEAIFREAAAMGFLAHSPAVRAIATSDYPTAAVRPLRAVLATNPQAAALVTSGFDYRAGLTSTLQAHSENRGRLSGR